MIPRIANLSKVEGIYKKFLQALAGAGFSGEIEERYSARLLCATDNSVYQRMPQAVVFPKSKQDVVALFKLAANPVYKSVVFAPRGGGTGTNGQSLTSGIVIDMSRHMKGVGQIDALERSVWVEAGVIKDELNEALVPYNLFFSPELSTSSRATIGGMISNDAAGQGSLKYGRTSQHITEVEVVLMDGTLTKFGPMTKDEVSAACSRPGVEGEIYRKVSALLQENAAAVEEHFPKLNRFMTGYDLAHAYDAKTGVLNLARLVCGAEGTLCTVVGAKLDLTLKPVFRALCVIKYENFDSALRHAQVLIDAGAFSVETVDSKVLGLAKKDPVWLNVKDYITDVPGATIDGVNIVEFNGYEAESERKLMDRLYKDTLKKADKRESGILGAQIADTPAAIAAIYGMRKKAVGLLGSAAGAKKLVAFTEDTVVPPQNLADYILEFRALMDDLGVEYGMFGHVDTGLMHVRPALDLTTDEDKQKLFKISHGVVELVKKYGGQMWGEHGRGYRSCFGEVFFGDLYPVARKVKAIFDGDNRLNPGKICVPWGNEQDKIVSLDSLMRGDLDRTIALNVRQSFDGALNCNGNGQCFSYSTAALMCPSYRYTKDHVKSPKGYSGLMREWLRLMTERGYDADALERELNAQAQLGRVRGVLHSIKSWGQRAFNTLTEHDDFNHEYLAQVDTCVACKSCKTQCPAHVNSAELNSRFLNFYYSRYLRPTTDLLCLHAEKSTPYLAATLPKFANKVLKLSLTQWTLDKIFHFVDVPLFSERTLGEQAKDLAVPVLSYKEALRRARHFDVIIVTDVFTSSYEVDGLMDLARVIKGLGFKVAFLKPYVNGKLFIIRGARGLFLKYATVQAKRLSDLEGMGVTLVGFDPALTICYRDEYPALVPNCPSFKVLLPEEWLEKALASDTFKQRAERFESALNELIPSAATAAQSAQASQNASTTQASETDQATKTAQSASAATTAEDAPVAPAVTEAESNAKSKSKAKTKSTAAQSEATEAVEAKATEAKATKTSRAKKATTSKSAAKTASADKAVKVAEVKVADVTADTKATTEETAQAEGVQTPAAQAQDVKTETAQSAQVEVAQSQAAQATQSQVDANKVNTAAQTGSANVVKGTKVETAKVQTSYGDFSQDYHLFCHCTEQALVPLSVKTWQNVLAAFHLKLKPVPVACCGMAGLFGHMSQHQAESKGVYVQNWQPKLHAREFKQCLITGFSCRSQVERMEGQKPNHPIHVLAELIDKVNAKAR